MRKITSNNMTDKILNKSFKSTVKVFIARDKTYSFMKTIKGEAAYSKKNST